MKLKSKDALIMMSMLILTGCSRMKVANVQQLVPLLDRTYVYATITMLVALAFSILVAQLIAFQPRNDRSYITRRIWSIIICLVSAAGFWLYNQLYVMGTITKDALQDRFAMTNLACLGRTIGGYAVLGLVVALVFRKSKFATVYFKNIDIKN